MPRAQSALHEIYRRRGATWEERGQWQVPAAFASVDVEVAAAQTTVGLGERWDAGVLELEGEELQDLADRLGVASVNAGMAVPLSLTRIPEARWCRLTRSRALILVDGESRREVRSGLEVTGSCVHLSDLSSALTTLALLGPRGPDLLARLLRIDVDPRVFADRAVALTGAVGIPMQILRWDLGPVLSYELTVGRDVAAYFWEALTHAGEELDLTPIGAEALSRLRAPANNE